jgi:hypothetical protein
MPNPPGNGPRTGQVVVGVAVPVCLTFVARVRALEASTWALASVALTGGLIVFLAHFVEYVIRPA